ncbi:signal peptidase I [Calditerrivibrio nitroreducens]|uniref:Signal peptidase I n=1 Tax=Calditerrivibrio nitroreducens (strain DSM 19672 / NBRC 101217 / Yu37-1) TaxID=768670 RepID=E4THG4_CALNY|nr:signal peptidase I [Calditerrivibrio nitroreducens]ADR19899.1 signal peptidase I [Calditerrivibrio nitroreducens DSM 19672]
MSQEEAVVKKNKFKDTIDSIVVAFVVAMIIRAFFIQAYKIPSGSMLNTLLIGDHILVNKVAYLFTKPKNGDIIVFEYPLEPEKDFIKRVIAVPGDRIKMVNKKVFLNGKPLNEGYTRYESEMVFPEYMNPRDNFEEITIPKGYYFVMGDNRDASFDSRFWGFVPEKSIKGKALIIYWSWNFGGKFEFRFNRLLKLIK